MECKSCYGNTLPFSNITDNQWNGLLVKSKIDGVIAGVMLWFIDHDETVFIPIEVLQASKDAGNKSVNVKDLYHSAYATNMIDIRGKKKRVFFDYDMSNFFSKVEKYLWR
jgi:hypothetical protein